MTQKEQDNKDFKFIGIRPLKGCNPDFRKVLSEEIPYVLYSNYDFSFYSESNRVIKIDSVNDIDLYSIQRGRNDKISINISAIVGKNGSGKSSLIELFYVSVFNLSVINHILYDEINERTIPHDEIVPDIKVEIFFKINNTLFLVHLDDLAIVLYESTDGVFVQSSVQDWNWDNFFYSIAINYSHYALNSVELKSWIKNIFHKNDAYQTPIVLNPFRKEGIIDINKENYLTRSRLLSNVLSDNKKLRELTKGKTVKYLRFSVDDEKIEVDKREINLYEENIDKIIKLVEEIFLKDLKKINVKNAFADETKRYIFRKLSNICKKYKHYKGYRRHFTKYDGIQFKKYITALHEDSSHITLKLRQAIYFLTAGSCIEKSEVGKLQSIDNLAKKLKVVQGHTKRELIEIIPPSFFLIEIFFDAKNNSFEKLSSGEKQKIYSISSLTYHLSNLDSVKKVIGTKKNSEDRIEKYSHVNIIFDEIELYYHPDLQRVFIYDLVDRIRKIKLKSINGINFIFVTHSPFILSDIPSQNILFLDEKGMPYGKSEIGETFGANIHDLLRCNFFLDSGYVGEFAKMTISHVVDKLVTTDKPSETEKSNISKIISIVGEPIIKQRLQELYDEKFKTVEELRDEIKRLNKLIEYNEKNTN